MVRRVNRIYTQSVKRLAKLLAKPAFFLTSLLLSTQAHAVGLVDLHAHFFMPEASGFPFFGSFNDPLHASRWTSRLKTRVNAEELQKSDVRIAVVALYSHPLFFKSLFGGQRASIREQIKEARGFVASHPDWIIAKSAAEARKAIDEGKRVMILSIEGISGILENDADINEFIDQDGVRIVTPLHFFDDWVGGAALMPGPAALVNPFAAFGSFITSLHDENGVLLNDQGLKIRGQAFITKLVEHGIWIDLSHASDASIKSMIPILQNAHQPGLITHTILRKAYHAERGVSEKSLQFISESDGIVGLLPSDDMLKGTLVNPALCPSECGGHCEGGEAAFATQYEAISKIVPSKHIFFGTDIDAPINFLKPECDAMLDKLPLGYWRYSQLPDLFDFLRDRKLTPPPAPGGNELLVDSFLSTWAKVQPAHE